MEKLRVTKQYRLVSFKGHTIDEDRTSELLYLHTRDVDADH